jgi:hypothetical protein
VEEKSSSIIRTAFINSSQSELRVELKKSPFEMNPITYLPSETFRQSVARDRPRPIFEKGLLLILRNSHVGIDLKKLAAIK